MVIIVTGVIGTGKTTVCRKLVEMLRSRGYSCGGILTYKADNENIIVKDIQSGQTEVLAGSSTVYDGPSTPRYSFNPEGIEFGLRAIDRQSTADVLIVDEIGHLELRGEGFFQVPELIKSGGIKNCVLVIRQQLLSHFLSELDVVEPVVYEVTIDNRDRLSRVIMGALEDRLTEMAG